MIEAGSEKWMLGMPLLAMNVTFILTNNLAPGKFFKIRDFHNL